MDKDNKGLLLDVGCSHGAFDFEFARRAYMVIGVDINKENISAGDKIKDFWRLRNITFFHMDILFNISVPYVEHIIEYEKLVGAFRMREGTDVCVGEGGSLYRNGYNLERMRTLLKRNEFVIMSWEYLRLPPWLEAFIITFIHSYQQEPYEIKSNGPKG